MVKYNRRDNDCHKYLIPEDLLARFDELLEKLESVRRPSAEYYDLDAQFGNEFQKYMVG